MTKDYADRIQAAFLHATERLQVIHDGNPDYFTWLGEANKRLYGELVSMPAAIHAAGGLASVELIEDWLAVLVASHKFFFAMWRARKETGLVALENLLSGWKH